ncbi:MAG: hypothetical protein EON60_02425 [Alphaproteobacteria bacterium]|nr:MAG: hypothetical protein EON60_02425 [Alphaproteobacteria bacterium]
MMNMHSIHKGFDALKGMMAEKQQTRPTPLLLEDLRPRVNLKELMNREQLFAVEDDQQEFRVGVLKGIPYMGNVPESSDIDMAAGGEKVPSVIGEHFDIQQDDEQSDPTMEMSDSGGDEKDIVITPPWLNPEDLPQHTMPIEERVAIFLKIYGAQPVLQASAGSGNAASDTDGGAPPSGDGGGGDEAPKKKLAPKLLTSKQKVDAAEAKAGASGKARYTLPELPEARKVVYESLPATPDYTGRLTAVQRPAQTEAAPEVGNSDGRMRPGLKEMAKNILAPAKTVQPSRLEDLKKGVARILGGK